MLSKHITKLILVAAVCTMVFLAAPSGGKPVYASQEDALLFQEALSTLGRWFNYGQHGLVWRPGQVDKNWRPYTNGRWVPTKEGYVFETDEPWGWATYHYGNWMPTNDQGWVWVPGRTWYPHTVNWRTSDENVGWAPVPPPDMMPSETSFTDSGDSYPATDLGSSGISSYNSYQNGILPSNWIFTRATDFLLGWGQPYSSAYSYSYAGVLAAPQYIPVIYERTIYVTNYVSPGYAPNAYYNWGPPVTYITRITKINNIEFNRRCQEMRLAHLHHVMPPDSLLRRHPAWREMLPLAGAGKPNQLRSVPNLKLVSGKLNYPDAMPAPASLNQGTRAPATAKQSTAAGGKGQRPDNRNIANLPIGTGISHVTSSPSQSQASIPARTGTAATADDLKKKPEYFQKNLPTPVTPAPGQQLPASRPYQSGEYKKLEPKNYQEKELKHYQEQRSIDRQRAEQELKLRQQQRLLLEQQRQREAVSHTPELQQKQNRFQEQQRRQADIQRYQQMQQQQRQAESMRQQQMQQQQQAVQQQHQAEMMRAHQVQQQQMVHRAPPPQSAPRTSNAQPQKKREHQQ